MFVVVFLNPDLYSVSKYTIIFFISAASQHGEFFQR